MEQSTQTTRERAVLLLRATFLLGRQPSAGQALVWAIRGAIGLGVFVLIASAVDRPLWDWLELLIIPAVLAIGGYLFTRSENRATRVAAEQRAQDKALQSYLDRIGQLVTDKDLRNERDTTNLRTLARAYTLTVLGGLDGRRKRSVIRFLYEAGLIRTHERVIALDGADLRGADLEGMILCNRVLHSGDLLGETDLMARAEEMGLYPVEIAQTATSVNLMGVDLSCANLRRADLGGAELFKANLSGADLSDARGIREQQLEEQCKVLVGATLPNGQKYEDWVKSKGRGEDGENSGPS